MNIKRNYISTISGKTVTWMLFVLLFSLTTLSSCRDDRMDYEPTPPDPNELTADVLFEINLPESATPSTYELTPENEDEIKTVEILIFKIKDGKKTYTGKPYYCDNIITGAISKEKYFIVSLPKGGPYDIVVLTNSRTAVKEQIVDVSVPKGTEKAALLELLTLKHDTKWDTDAATTNKNYRPIPMWGEIKDAEITWNLKFKTRLMRMLAKIDVEISTDATSSFTLQEIYLANPNTDGQIVPTHFYPNGTISAPTLTGSAPKISNIVYASSEATGPGVYKNVIYTFEANKADTTSSATWSKSTCLILKGTYKADGGEYFYRIDFGNRASGAAEYLDILRNMQYSVKISRINAPGYATYVEALASLSSNIESETVVWDHSELPIIVFDSNYALGFSSDDITMSFHAGTTNQMKIRTDYPAGWKVDKIVDSDEISPIPTPTWFTIPTASASGVFNDTADVAFTTLENNTGSSRVCYIHFSAGDLKHRVKVTQMKAFKMAQVVWKDYVGPDFNTITIKDELGYSYTSKVNSTGYLVADDGTTLKPMIFGAIIAEVKVTYKKYVLTVPTANYFHNYGTNILYILDRSLIGLPIHLDKIRDSLAGSYIQVDHIDLKGYKNTNGDTNNWMPIGTKDEPFTGNYLGTLDTVAKVYYKIKTLLINRPGMDYVGLFGYCSNDSFLKLILIESGSIKGRSYVGAIGGQIGKIQSATSYASVEAVSDYVGSIAGSITNAATSLFFYFNETNWIKGGGNNIGGICGINSGEIDNCSTHGTQNSTNSTISGSGTNVGGVCGINKGKMYNCNSHFLEIKGVINVGGIAGSNSGTIDFCHNTTSNITGSGLTSVNVGGIVGLNEIQAIITNSTNNGTIIGIKSVGGIAGSTDNSSISNCTNKSNGVVKGVTNVGGIAGQSNTSTIQKCINDYDKDNNIDKIISTGENLGGICGFATKSTIAKSRNRAVVAVSETGEIHFIGGICGHLYEGSTIQYCENEKDAHIKGSTAKSEFVGGISGNNTDSQILNCINNATYEGFTYLGGISGRNNGASATVTACYNIGGRPTAATESGAIIGALVNGAPPAITCYYGGAAIAGNANGAHKFVPGWPTGSSWEEPFPWLSLGGPSPLVYPKLNWDSLMLED